MIIRLKLVAALPIGFDQWIGDSIRSGYSLLGFECK